MSDPAMSSPRDAQGAGAPPALRMGDIWHRYYRGAEFSLRGASLAVPRGAAAVILGLSGSGKTTLLKAASGLISPTRGRVEALGLPLTHGTLRGALRGRIGYVPQQLGLVRHRTALQNALVGALPRTSVLAAPLHDFAEGDIRFAREILREVGLAHKADEKVFRLSGGERQRVAIARTLVQRPDLILADEFVSDLDDATTREIMRLVFELRASGTTLVMAMHDLELTLEYAERIVVLDRGQVVLEAEPSAVNTALLREVLKSARLR